MNRKRLGKNKQKPFAFEPGPALSAHPYLCTLSANFIEHVRAPLSVLGFQLNSWGALRPLPLCGECGKGIFEINFFPDCFFVICHCHDFLGIFVMVRKCTVKHEREMSRTEALREGVGGNGPPNHSLGGQQPSPGRRAAGAGPPPPAPRTAARPAGGGGRCPPGAAPPCPPPAAPPRPPAAGFGAWVGGRSNPYLRLPVGI